MDMITRLKLTIGDLIVQLAAAHEEIEKLKAERGIKAPEQGEDAEVVNFSR